MHGPKVSDADLASDLTRSCAALQLLLPAATVEATCWAGPAEATCWAAVVVAALAWMAEEGVVPVGVVPAVRSSLTPCRRPAQC